MLMMSTFQVRVKKLFFKEKSRVKIVYRIFVLFALFFLTACQESATSNHNSNDNTEVATLKYPLKTGQNDIFSFVDTSSDPASYYFDDGYDKKGYAREFNRLTDDTVYNSNYSLVWQDDDNVSLEYNATAAKAYCEALSLAGKTDWRLPNIFELTTLFDLGSATDVRESSFLHMPAGYYFSNTDVVGTDKTIVVGFGENDFNITKIDKVFDIDENQTHPTYGEKVGQIQTPKYDSDGILLYITDGIIYYNTDTGLETTITTVTRYDINGTILSVDGPFINSETPLHPPEVSPTQVSYVKCVSGTEIKGFNFVRDDRNDVVIDSATALMWQDSKEVVQNRQQWGEALRYCSQLTLGGYRDWRVPTISELISINDFSNGGTHSVNSAFLYKSATRFHSSSDACFYKTDDPTCYQKNYQLNACGYLDEKITLNLEIDNNAYDGTNEEPYYQTRCVRLGNYN